MSALLQLWQQTLAILWKDIRLELRTRQVWGGMALFSVLVLVVFNFAFDLRVTNLVAVAPGALWIAFVFASILGLGRTYAVEQEQGSMDRLLVCPVDRKAIYFAKLLGNMLFIGVVEVISVPLFAAAYNLPILTLGIVPIAVFGTLGVASIGTLFSAITAATRAREVLLPLLVFPLIVPVVIGSVRATQDLVSPAGDGVSWLGLIIAFDVIFLSLSAIMFQYVIEE
ncbi:MAG: heme exporter protein CcmB [Ktedonobacterales bacterium]